jgi:hypothetical protein
MRWCDSTVSGGSMAGERIWLDVPYQEKDEANSLGARCGHGRSPARGSPPRELLPGEDRSFGSGLFVDLVPSSCWFTNVRSCVDRRDWERLRRMVTTRADQLGRVSKLV